MDVTHDLPGWRLAWYRLDLAPGAVEAAAEARASAAAAAREALAGRSLVDLPAVAEVRRLFREAGTDPTRYRPSSEALLRRVLRGEELPAIHPLVDLNNCLSVALAVPSCVMPEGSFHPPLRLRAGRPGDRYESLRGDFDLAGKPLLEDGEGPFGSPLSDSLRVAIEPDGRSAVLVAYLPAALPRVEAVRATLDGLAGIARWSHEAFSGGSP
jgi:DNA/RNA-binding domain of Phe-tRNA-synthetase-like protein